MLYVTTRNTTVHYTANQALCNSIAPDGGLYVPFAIPQLSSNELKAFKNETYAKVVSQILNVFFSGQISEWEVERCTGKHPLQIYEMNRKILLVQLWNGMENEYCAIVRQIYCLMMKNLNADCPRYSWPGIAIRIATLFGVYAQLHQTEVRKLDLALCADDFDMVFAAWYARKMGLPINLILNGFKEDNKSWDLFQKGTLSVSDVIDSGEHRFLHCALGDAWSDYRTEKHIELTKEHLLLLNQDLYAAVVGQERVESIVNNSCDSGSVVLGEDSARAYGALQDYRATNGQSRLTLMFAYSNHQRA